MKLYLFYLVINDRVLKKYAEEDVLDFIDVTEFLNYEKNKSEQKDLGIYKYLYAHTLDKKLAEKFEDMHNMKDFFVKIVKNVSESEYNSMYSEIVGTEICQKDLKTGAFCNTFNKKYSYDFDEGRYLIMTTNEYDAIELMFHTNICEMIMTYSSHEYLQFKKKYIEALDKLLYCTNQRMNYYDSEFYSYNFSYGITAEGAIPAGRAGMCENLLNVYIHYFKIILKGYK